MNRSIRQRGDDLLDVRKRCGEVVAGARVERHAAVVLLGEQSIAVVLELEDPARARERLARRREHRRQLRPAQRARLRAALAQARRDRDAAVLRGPDLLDRASREHRVVRVVVGARLSRVRVALLDQEPLVLAALGLHERPFAAQLVAAQLEQQLAFDEALVDVVERHPAAAVPDDHRARAVVAGRDQPLEVRVLDGVVLDVDREPLVGRVRRRALRHGPGLQHAVVLEPEVVVRAPRRVLLDDEPRASYAGRAERLRSLIRLSLCAISL